MIILYSTHCPKCHILERKLQEKHIAYYEDNDVKTMLEKDFTEAPMLEIDGTALNFSEAIAWLNKPELDGV